MDDVRLPLLRPEELDDEQRALYDAVAGSPRAASPGRAPLADEQGRLAGPFNAMLYSPRIGQALQQLGTAVRYASGLSPRAREIAILEVARHCRSGYEWQTHVTAAAAAGLTPAEIERLADGGDAPAFDRGEACVRAVTRSLLTDRDVPGELYAAARDTLGEALIVELTVLTGYYQLLAGLLAVARVPPPLGPAADEKGGRDE
jgi:alkylhydroperoxidase family enzyme